MDKKKTRCAIYTRKSSEEGLEQDFNSLDAQREACEAYIKSQMHEGWTLIKKEYNDGGFSGGTMNRPAFQELLKDIEENKIDIVVVYKVDRLTRSLMDFSKIIDVFDKHETSFVSITQQFNTTTSMGRLTLNILLSFAQFEREVTGERIRDKIAASKKRGMWVGGRVPIGYKKENKKLVIDEENAQKVRFIFDKYLELKSVPKLKNWLESENIKTRTGKIFAKGELYHVLSNKVYIGKIVHKDNVYKGEHKGIIENIIFENVQKLLFANKVDKICGTKCSSNSLLAGLIFDDNNNRMSPSHSTSHKRRYRYYVSQANKSYNNLKAGSVSKIPAGEIENFIVQATCELFNNKKQMQKLLSEFDVNAQIELIKTAKSIEDYSNSKLIRSVLKKVVIAEKTVEITYNAKNIKETLLILNSKGELSLIPHSKEIEPIVIAKQIKITQPSKSGNILILNAKENEAPEPNPYLINALVKCHYYHKQIQTGKTIEDLQNEENLKDTKYIRNILNLKYIPADLTEQILEGSQPEGLSLQELMSKYYQNTSSMDGH